jgi:hypothetical protein
MDYNKLNSFLGNLKIDENAEYEKRKNQIMNRDFNFLNEEKSKKINFDTFNNFNKQTRLNEPEINTDFKGDINNRLKTREYIPNTGSLNIHGKDLPIIERFPKSSKNYPSPQ